MITAKTLPAYYEKFLLVHGDMFVVHRLSNGSLIIADNNLGYKANIEAINEAGIKWFTYMLGAKITGVIQFSEITES